MSLPNPYLQYQQNAVQGAGPGELTMMLYNGLVKFLMLSLNSVNQKNIYGAHNNLLRSQEIIIHLNETLDHSYGLSKNLSALYEYMNRRLREANVNKDVIIIEEILGLAKELRDTWEQALKLIKEQG